jgi:histidine triad (HIT) family protein
VVAFLADRPIADRHTLIVPKAHVRDFASDPDISARVMRCAAELVHFSPQPMAILSLRGEAAGQEVMHFHLHLIPRSAGDGLRVISRKGGGRKR